MSLFKSRSNIDNARNQKGIGLLEALISLAIVGTAMVLITQFSLRTIKMARRNELQDVASQVSVEALDYMKQPGTIYTGQEPSTSYGSYYALNFALSEPLVYISDEGATAGEGEIFECAEDSDYWVNLGEGYLVCQQIFMKAMDTYGERWDVKVIIAWQTVGRADEFEYSSIESYRFGSVEIVTP